MHSHTKSSKASKHTVKKKSGSLASSQKAKTGPAFVFKPPSSLPAVNSFNGSGSFQAHSTLKSVKVLKPPVNNTDEDEDMTDIIPPPSLKPGEAHTLASDYVRNNWKKFKFSDGTFLVDKKGKRGEKILIDSIRQYISEGLDNADKLEDILGELSKKKVNKGKGKRKGTDGSDDASARWIKRKQTYIDHIENANVAIFTEQVQIPIDEAREELNQAIKDDLEGFEIEELENFVEERMEEAAEQISQFMQETDGFFTNSIQGPQTLMVAINGLKEAVGFKRSKTQSRIASFTTSVLECAKASGGKTPEVQLALVQHKASAPSPFGLAISGNDANSNDTIRDIFQKETLSESYERTIRPFHVGRRVGELHAQLERIDKAYDKAGNGGNYVSKNLPMLNALLSTLDWNEKKSVYVDKKTGKRYGEDVIEESAIKHLATDIHKLSKSSTTNRKRKSAKRFVKAERFKGAHRKVKEIKAASLRISVPKNTNDIHAESAILEDLIKKNNDALVLVAGTKVACTACQAYYTKHNHQEHIGNYTSFAWMSKSSMKQLGFNPDQVEAYLIEIRNMLHERRENMLFYAGSSGTFKDTELDYESSDSDSEDEDAMEDAKSDVSKWTIVTKLLKDLKRGRLY